MLVRTEATQRSGSRQDRSVQAVSAARTRGAIADGAAGAIVSRACVMRAFALIARRRAAGMAAAAGRDIFERRRRACPAGRRSATSPGRPQTIEQLHTALVEEWGMHHRQVARGARADARRMAAARGRLRRGGGDASPAHLRFIVAAALQARCPTARAVSGVLYERRKPDGSFECRPVLGSPEHDLDGARARRALPDGCAIRGRIACTGGSRPIVVDGRTVACQPGGWP
jgi:hypothetical protein